MKYQIDIADIQNRIITTDPKTRHCRQMATHPSRIIGPEKVSRGGGKWGKGERAGV